MIRMAMVLSNAIPAFLDGKDQIAAQFAHDGNFRPGYEPKLGQMLTHIITAIDLLDDVHVPHIRHS